MPINKMKNHIRLKGTSRALKRNIDIIHNGLLKREGLLSCLVFVFVFYLAKYTPSFYYPALSLAIASTIGFFGIAMAKKIHNNQTEMSKMLHNESIKAKIIIQDSLIESAFIQKENYKHSTKNARLSIPFRVVRGSISHVKVRAQVDFDEDVITEMNTFYTLSEEHPRFVYSKTGRGKKLYFENRDGYSANISLADKNTTQHNLKHESIEGVKYFIYLGTDYVVLTDFYMNYVNKLYDVYKNNPQGSKLGLSLSKLDHMRNNLPTIVLRITYFDDALNKWYEDSWRLYFETENTELSNHYAIRSQPVKQSSREDLSR